MNTVNVFQELAMTLDKVANGQVLRISNNAPKKTYAFLNNGMLHDMSTYIQTIQFEFWGLMYLDTIIVLAFLSRSTTRIV